MNKCDEKLAILLFLSCSSQKTNQSTVPLREAMDVLCFPPVWNLRGVIWFHFTIFSRAGIASCKSAGLVIERLRVRILAGAAGEFSSLDFVCWFLFSVHSTPMLPQWHVKDPGHSAKSAGGKLYRNTQTALIQRSRSGLTMLLSRHSVGTYLETSSHATCQGT